MIYILLYFWYSCIPSCCYTIHSSFSCIYNIVEVSVFICYRSEVSLFLLHRLFILLLLTISRKMGIYIHLHHYVLRCRTLVVGLLGFPSDLHLLCSTNDIRYCHSRYYHIHLGLRLSYHLSLTT